MNKKILYLLCASGALALLRKMAPSSKITQEERESQIQMADRQLSLQERQMSIQEIQLHNETLRQVNEGVYGSLTKYALLKTPHGVPPHVEVLGRNGESPRVITSPGKEVASKGGLFETEPAEA